MVGPGEAWFDESLTAIDAYDPQERASSFARQEKKIHSRCAFRIATIR